VGKNIVKNILALASNYSTLFVDVYGVLFDGFSMYSHVLNALENLKKNGKRIVIISNSSQVSSDAKAGYARRGMIQEIHYDKFITSGEFLHYLIKEAPEKFSKAINMNAMTYKCIFIGNESVFHETFLQKADLPSADFLYVGIPRVSYGSVRIDDVLDASGRKVNIEDVVCSNWNELRDSQGRKGFKEFQYYLEKCLEKNKTLLVANPDIFSTQGIANHDRGYVLIVTQGAIGLHYQKMGGKTIFLGKPYSGIFKYAQQIIDCPKPILMVGDTPWTDIAGANAVGIDSAMTVSTGIASHLIKSMDNSFDIEKKLDYLFGGISEKMLVTRGNTKPTYLVHQFATGGAI
jgi:ribonucleotide monophosphatase NagD (HAD superfamily)